MAYQAESLALARAASRMNFTRGNILPPRWTPNPIEDTTPETLDAIRRSLAKAQTYRDPLEDTGDAAARRARLSEPAAIPKDIPRKPSPTEFRGQHRTFTLHVSTIVGAGNSGQMGTELFYLPSIVRRVMITTDAVAASEIELLVTTTQNNAPLDPDALLDPPIFPDSSYHASAYGVYAVAAGAPFAVPMDHVITKIPFALLAWIRNTNAGPHRAQVHITMQDLDPEDLRTLTVPIIMQQQVLTRSLTSPAPPAPRQFTQPYEWLGVPTPGPTKKTAPTQAPPRGLRLGVYQNGTKLYSRDIPWAVVDPVMKVEFMTALFNNKMPLGMEPIW